MSWTSALLLAPAAQQFARPDIPQHTPDWTRLVALDFETFWDQDYTLKKMSTSEYIRDPRFKAQMLGIKVGHGATRLVPPARIASELAKINWATHSLLAHNCVPGDTEVLTRNGWKPINRVAVTQEIMQWDPVDSTATWCYPLHKTTSTAKELIRWNTSFHRGAYTPEHRMYYQTPGKAEWRADTAENIAQKGMNNTYVPLSGLYAGLPSDLSEPEARLMEAIRADGTWLMTDGVCYGAGFNLRKARKIERLKELCAVLNLNLAGPSAQGLFRITKSEVTTRLFGLLGSTKWYGFWVIDLPLNIRQTILEEMKFWDGHDAGTKCSFEWSTACYTTACSVETMAHLSGWSLSGYWVDNSRGYGAGNPNSSLFIATVRRQSRAKLRTAPTKEKFRGSVFCFTVPTGAFLIRANGRICVTGNCQFDGFILSHHYGVHPARLYDSLAMARGLHSNDIGAGLDEVSHYYDGPGKIEGALDETKGVRTWPKDMFHRVSAYCANDVDEMFRVFKLMLPRMPADEIDLIDMITRMFTSPVLRVNIPRVQAELTRELASREKLMYAAVDPDDWDDTKLLKGKEKQLQGVERDMLIIKRVIGSNERFAELLRAEDVEPPTKISAAWIKKSKDERDDDDKHGYAFAKDDAEFINLPNKIDGWGFDLEDPDQVAQMAARQERLQALVDVRLAVKSTTNITRAQRFLTAGANGMLLPVGYAYSRAHTHRLGGANKMNMQNLVRGGELRQSIEAPRGQVMVVVDSGQIEARVNGWLWGQKDLLDAFVASDTGTGSDAYCTFGNSIYDYKITKETKVERFVAKVCVLGLGYQMGAPKLQITLAKGALGGPPVYFSLTRCVEIVNIYRLKNSRIRNGWSICQQIIEDMAAGVEGSHGPISWEANTIWLPNGMYLHYPDLRKAVGDKGWDEWSYAAGKMRKKIYGGLLTENIVQALARIIVMWQMLQVGRKYRVVMTTHDEVVAVAPKRSAATCFAFMERWMKTAPSWCPDIPLNCEGGWAENYSK